MSVSRSWLVWAIAAVACLEAVWLVWFLVVPLPNTGNKLTRGHLALVALPGIAEPSTIGSGLARLSRVEHLPQRVPILLAAGLIAAGASAGGLLLLRALRLRHAFSRWERLSLSFGLGMAVVSVLTLLGGRLGLLGTWSTRAVLVVPIACELALSFRAAPRSGRLGWSLPATLGWLALVAPFLVGSLLAAMLPTIDYDALEYHLQGPKEYFQAGRVQFLPHNVYTSMPFQVEMWHLLGMYVIGDWWLGALVGQVLIWAHVLAASAFIAGTATRWGSPRAGWVAALVFLVTPWVARLAALPYVEGPLLWQHAALVWVAALMWTTEAAVARRLGVVLGLLAGSALATKYPALISAVVPFGGLALADACRRRAPAVLGGFVVGTLAIAGPWLVKNVVDHANPVYPLAWKVFGGHPWSAAREAKWANAHGPKPIVARDFLESVVDVAGRSDWQSFLYTGLVPLALVRAGTRRLTWAIGCYVMYIFLTWWLFTHRLDRFWLPLLPGLAVLAGLGADWTTARAWSFALGPLLFAGCFLGLAHAWTDLVGLNDWTADLRLLRAGVPRQLNPALARLDAALPPTARPLLVGQAAVFHMDHTPVFNTVFDDEVFESIAKDRAPEDVARAFQRLGTTHVYVDWHEIERHRKPGGYGFTDFVQPREFDRLVRAGVLGPPQAMDEEGKRLLHEVTGPKKAPGIESVARE